MEKTVTKRKIGYEVGKQIRAPTKPLFNRIIGVVDVGSNVTNEGKFGFNPLKSGVFKSG